MQHLNFANHLTCLGTRSAVSYLPRGQSLAASSFVFGTGVRVAPVAGTALGSSGVGFPRFSLASSAATIREAMRRISAIL